MGLEHQKLGDGAPFLIWNIRLSMIYTYIYTHTPNNKWNFPQVEHPIRWRLFHGSTEMICKRKSYNSCLSFWQVSLYFPIIYIYIYTDIYIYWSLLKAWLFGRCAWCPWCLWRKNVIKKEPRLGILRPKVSNWAAGQFVDVLDGGSRIARQRKTIKPFDGQWNSVDCTINDVVLGVPFNLELMWIN